MIDGSQHVFFTLDADGSTTEATGDYSAAVARFTLKPAATDSYFIDTITVCIKDTDSDANLYGNLPALTNGVKLAIERVDGSTIETLGYLMDGLAVKKTDDWCAITEPIPLNNSDGETKATTVFLKFEKPFVLRGDKGHQLSFILNDDLSGLDSHTFVGRLHKQLVF
jgi:hypothetical protein